MLEDEINLRIQEIFPVDKLNQNDFPYLTDYGYTIINEFIAQTIAQKLVYEKYKDKYKNTEPFPIQHRRFCYNENGYLSENEAFTYEYYSNLDFYGEIEEFALKFIRSIYGEKDIDRVFAEHFNGNVFNTMVQEYEKREGGIENLYQVFGHMSNIIIGDYYQQGYLGEERHENWSNITLFKNSISEFNRIINLEIKRARIGENFGDDTDQR